MIIVASAGVELVPTIAASFRRDVDQHGRRAGEQFGNAFNRGADGRTRSTMGSRFGQRAAGDAGRAGDGAGKAFGQRFKAGVTTLGVGLVAGVTLFAKAAVDAASDSQQSIGATEAIYGKFANRVIDRSNKAAAAVGLSANAYRESANLLGALFKNQGVELKRLSDTTDEHLKLASDLSAMYGGTVPDAVEALTAAYKGEFNQLEKYGVTLKQDTINTTANEVAKRKFGKELKNLGPAQESVSKQLATQQLLFKQTKDATGSFGREANTLAGQQQRLGAELGNVRAEVGGALLPILSDLAIWARREIVPAIQDFSRYLGENKDEIRAFAHDAGDLAKTIGQELVPHLKTAGEVVAGTVKFFSDLPGPVKEIGAQALIAAVVLPKLTAGILAVRGATLAASAGMLTFGQRIAQNRAAMTYQTTLMGKAAAAVHGFGGIARQAAGVGGILLLTQGMQQSNDKAKAFMTTMGGIATGLALGGPVGAVIGGIAGLFLGLKDHITGAKQAAKLLNEEAARNAGLLQWREALERVRDTLDQMSGAATQTTRQWALERLQAEDVLKGYEALGISQRTAVSAVLGNKKALAELNAKVGETDPVIAMLNNEFREQQAATRDAADATATLADRLGLTSAEVKKIPRKVRIAIEDDVPDSLHEIKTLGALVNGLDKRTIRILLKAADLPATKANIEKVKKEIQSVGSVKIYPQWKNKFTTDLNSLRAEAKKTGQKAGRDLNTGTADTVKTTTGIWSKVLKSKLREGGGAKPDAAAGGKGIGLNLAVGTALGVLSGIPSVTAAAITMARAAEQAAKNELDIHSPSRKFIGIGANTALGFARGINLNTGFVGKAIDRMMAAINTAVKKHNLSKTAGQQFRGIVTGIGREAAKLRNLVAARDELAKSVTSGLRGDFDLSSIVGKNEFGISQGPGQAVQAAQAIVARMKAFAEKLIKLTKAGLPGALVQEIAGYGSADGSRIA
ncbi:MAG TPA: hypothetical protein VNS46_00195, partial [Nocardioides sp.]|nr:hypothetical protein [Nocardioides sp.]